MEGPHSFRPLVRHSLPFTQHSQSFKGLECPGLLPINSFSFKIITDLVSET
jgi:hypothetical protein